MNKIKSLVLCAACLLFLGSQPLCAGEETTYVASLTGVECNACKRTVAKALSKLEGVKTIRIIKQGTDRHRLEVLTDGSHPIAKSEAIKALEKAEHYKIVSWNKAS